MHLSLFVYGTLHPERAPAAIAPAARLLRSIGRATVQGRLLDLGEYPGVILGDNSDDLVSGELFLLPEEDAEAKELIVRLDEYEGYRPHDSAQSLFLRERVLAKVENNFQQLCWIYTYNRALHSQWLAFPPSASREE